jgi:hypothetical protein
VTPSPRAFSRVRFDWPDFLRTLHLQPGAVWVALAALARPVSSFAPAALGASCSGNAREGVAQAAFIAYVLIAPLAGSLAWYFGFSRRRLAAPTSRAVAKVSLVLLAAVSALNAAVIGGELVSRWPLLSPGLSAWRSACWPGR